MPGRRDPSRVEWRLLGSGRGRAREIAENAVTWKALTRLGVRSETELSLEFVYESGGPAADRVLAEFLRREQGYEVEVAAEGIAGWKPRW